MTFNMKKDAYIDTDRSKSTMVQNNSLLSNANLPKISSYANKTPLLLRNSNEIMAKNIKVNFNKKAS